MNAYPDALVVDCLARTLRQWSDTETRSAIYDSLLQNRSDSARTLVVDLLIREPDVQLRLGLLKAFSLREGSAETPQVLSAVVRCLEDAQSNIRLAAVMALGQQNLKGNTAALEMLEACANADPSEEVRAAAGRVLERMKEE